MKTMKLFLCLCVFALFVGLTSELLAEELKIGGIYPLSGPMSEIGEQRMMGADIAVELINEEGGVGGQPIKLLIEDSQSDAKVGVNAFRNLTEIQGVKIIMVALSSVSMAIKPLSERASVLLFSNSTHPDLVKGSQYVIRNFFTIESVNQRISQFLPERKISKIGILHLNDDFGEATRRDIEGRAARSKFQVVVAESFSKGDTDTRSQLLRIKAKRPELVFVVGLGPVMTSIYRQARELHINSRFLGWAMCTQKALFEASKDYMEGTFSVDPYVDDSSAAYKKLAKRFYSKYPNKELEPNAVAEFDAINIIVDALRQGNRSPSEIKKYIVNTRVFDTASGRIEFSPDGESKRAVRIFEITGKRCQPTTGGS